MPVNHDMIIWCYRLFLAREPAPSDITHYLQKNASVAELRRMFCHSTEFLNGARYALFRDDTHYVSEFALLQQVDIAITEETVRYAHILILNQPCADDDLAHYLDCGHLVYLLKALLSSELYRSSPMASLIHSLPAHALKKINILELPANCLKDDVANNLSGHISYPEHLENQLHNISIGWLPLVSHDIDLLCDITLYSIPKLEFQLAGSCSINVGLNCTGTWVFSLLGTTQISIGNDTNANYIYAILQTGSSLLIGHDCYFEGDVHFRLGDSHAVVSMETLEVLNYKTNPYVEIQDHVTVGKSARFLADCLIGHGCAIEQGTLLKGTYPQNNLIVGSPGRAVQNDVIWSHSKLHRHLQQLANHA